MKVTVRDLYDNLKFYEIAERIRREVVEGGRPHDHKEIDIMLLLDLGMLTEATMCLDIISGIQKEKLLIGIRCLKLAENYLDDPGKDLLRFIEKGVDKKSIDKKELGVLRRKVIDASLNYIGYESKATLSVLGLSCGSVYECLNSNLSIIAQNILDKTIPNPYNNLLWSNAVQLAKKRQIHEIKEVFSFMKIEATERVR